MCQAKEDAMQKQEGHGKALWVAQFGEETEVAFPALFEGLEEFDSEEPQLTGGLLPEDSCRNGRRLIGNQA